MQLCACLHRKLYIAHSDYIFHAVCNSRQLAFFCIVVCVDDAAVYKVFIFTVRQYRNIQFLRDFHCLLQHIRIHYRLSVLTDRRDACLYHFFNIRKLRPFHFPSNGSCLQDIYLCYAFCLIVDIADYIRIIYNRFCIRHSHNRRKSAACRCRCTCGYCFLAFKSRIAQMHMHINKARHHIAAFSIDHTIRFHLLLRRNTLNFSVLHQHVCSSMPCITFTIFPSCISMSAKESCFTAGSMTRPFLIISLIFNSFLFRNALILSDVFH